MGVLHLASHAWKSALLSFFLMLPLVLANAILCNELNVGTQSSASPKIADTSG